ncbi:hypothetical protein FB451DRAFT_1412015 [Mycena latifolia]|nr:hypothetical protein FB451DRAFT_1412015 [Mycena latifolia]
MLKPKSSAKYPPLPSAEEIDGFPAVSDDEPLPAASSGQPSTLVIDLAVLPARGGPAYALRSAARRISRAAFLRHAAQDALERAWREGVWRYATGADALSLILMPVIIALHESSAHPEYHPDRLARPFGRPFAFLDEVLGALWLTAADACAPEVCRCARPGAECAGVPLGSPPRDLDTLGSSTLPWDPTWDALTVRAEEVRRLCSGAMSVATILCAECITLGRADGGAVAFLCRENVSQHADIHQQDSKMLRNLQGPSPGKLPGPLFDRRQAEEWIQYQNELVTPRVTLSIEYQYLSDPRGMLSCYV